jgi:endonuclease/exonuclease/phosphatase family metal-dependent hydrolase
VNANSRPRLARRLRRPATAALVAVLGVALAGLSAGPTGASGGVIAGDEVPPTSVRIIQANLLSGQGDAKFAGDLRKIFAQAPDFITYNEVPRRPDAKLAPAPYAMFRTPGKYTGATPIAWRADRWEALATGTYMISNLRGREPGQSVEWGVRYANWVTAREYATGRVVSAVSVHLTPRSKRTEKIIKPSVRRLGALVETLATSGPVLVGGDFNFHYTNRTEYPRDVLTEEKLTPTYDVTGTHAPTGDHRGATIDYIFLSKAEQFQVTGQTTTELNSDHDAVTVDVSMLTNPGQPVAFRPGPVVNKPSEGRAGRRVVLDLFVEAIDAAPAGAGIHLDTDGLADKRIYASLVKAVDRGVFVQFLTRRQRPNYLEKALFSRLKAKVRTRQWAVGCWADCRRVDKFQRVPVTRLLVSTAGATRALRVDSDQPAAYAASRNRTTASIRTSTRAYDRGFRQFLSLVGRSY